MKRLIAFIVAATGVVTVYMNCQQNQTNNNALIESIKGAWKLESYTCNNITNVETLVEHRLTFNDGTYEYLDTLSGCSVKRTGTWSASAGVLSTSYAGVLCSPSPCSGIYKINDQPTQFSCPQDISSDGQNFAVSVDSSTMFLTPTIGPNIHCYFKYVRL